MSAASETPSVAGFNEAAGFTQRKRVWKKGKRYDVSDASMRPPVLPSGNSADVVQCLVVVDASMRPPVLPSGNEQAQIGLTDTGNVLLQ